MNKNIEKYLNDNEKEIREILDSKEFYFSKLKELWKEFREFEISNKEIDSLIAKIKNYYKNTPQETNKFTKFLENTNGIENEILNLIGQIVSICDTNANEKSKFNPYDDDRTISNSGVNQNIWVISLLEFKKHNSIDKISSNNIKNTIKYILDPANEVPIVSQTHRLQIAVYLIRKDYKDIKNKLAQELKDFLIKQSPLLEELLKNCKNKENTTFLLAKILYECQKLKEIWNKYYWIFPANPKKYDAENAFEKEKKIWWNNQNIKDIKKNDIVFIYLSYPTQEIKLMTQVIQVIDPEKQSYPKIKNDLAYYKDNKFKAKKMHTKSQLKQLELIKTLNNNLTFKELKKNGLSSNLQSPLKITNPKLFSFIYDNISIKRETKENKMKQIKNNLLEEQYPLNLILYGPPGTGKTYKVIEKALEIIFEKEKDENLIKKYNNAKEQKDREKIKELFNKFKKKGQIEFITFHQNYSYEEFVEGIKPDLDNNDDTTTINYKIEDGIFKKLSIKSNITKLDKKIQEKLENLPDNIRVWKISLGYKREFVEDCFKKNEIRIGFDESFNKSLTEFSEQELKNQREIYDFYKNLTINDIVLVLKDSQTIDGIGIITGDYNFKNEYNKYRHIRKVEWIVKDKEINILKYNNNRRLSPSILYRLNSINMNTLIQMLSDLEEKYKSYESNKNFVLIIDEINRGNISKIFGELITLIEEDKRLGNEEELIVKLPYSKENFGVPNNLYILGTMNTADRSIALIDTALRRRFSFEEMMPQPDLLDGIKVNDIEIKEMLETINKRIEYLYDRDHTIGHAYFMELNKTPTIEKLEEIFRNKIIPLLQEYFYDDWEKIQIVLGDHYKQLGLDNECKDWDCEKNKTRFIQSKKIEEKMLIGFDHDDIENEKIKYRINPENFSEEFFTKIYKINLNKQSSNQSQENE